MDTSDYDPFTAGPHAVDVRTVTATDTGRDRAFPVRIWSPPGPGPCPVVVFSHFSGGNRNTATFLCAHLASHGYLVAAMATRTS